MKFIYKIIDIFLKVVYQSKENTWVFRLWDFSLRTRIHYFYFTLFSIFMELIFSALEPFSFGKLSKLITKDSFDFKTVQFNLLPMILILLFSRIASLLKNKFKNLFSLNYRLNLRQEYYTSLLCKDLEFFDNHKSSDLFYILTHDIQKVEYASILGLIDVFKKIIQLIVAIIMLFYLSTKLALFLCIVIPFVGLLESMKKNLVLKEEKKYTAKKKKSHFIVLEALDNMRIIKSFSTEEKEIKKYEKKLEQMLDIEYYGEMTCILYEGGTLALIGGILFVGIKYGLYLIKGNSLDIDTFISFFLYCKTILDNFYSVANSNRDFLKAQLFAEKIFFVLDYEPKIKSFFPKMIGDYTEKNEKKENIGIEKKINGKITLKNVFFEYPKEKGDEIVKVIKNISLDIYPGMKLGIVGFSGSGKSTLINLIERLYDVGFCEKKENLKIFQDKIIKNKEKEKNDDDESNNSEEDSDEEKKRLKKEKIKNKKKLNAFEEKLKFNKNIPKDKDDQDNCININENNCAILVDDINIKEYNLKSLHSQIGYVPQEPSLFDGTIRENIIYGLCEEENILYNNNKDKDPYEKELKWSLHTAQADFVFDENAFPLGLNTLVGSKGAKLSGGQKQRIAIARALIKKPKILILDEATSALDSESESKFQLELDNLKGKMTIIVVSHRLCTIKDCDQIVVINKGKIIEKGKHEELVAFRGVYHNLMEKQLEKE